MASSLDNEEEASVKSSWNALIRAQFPWLVGTSSAMSSSSYPQKVEDKINKILDTLNDNSIDGTVNLWALREESLEKGGLLSHTIRKRAWPKLVGAHEQVLLLPSCSSFTKVLEISQRDMVLLENDVAQPTVWNIQEHVSKHQVVEKKVTFARPGLTAISPTGSLESVTRALNEEDTTSPLTTTPSTTMYSSTSISPLLPRSIQEQTALKNTIINLLRTSLLFPNDDMEEEQDYQLHYYHGLQDLTSLLLINMESPSLVCLILQKLSSYSLRDTMKRNQVILKQTIHQVSHALLLEVDCTLFRHFRDVSWNDADILTSIYQKWIPSWFCSVLPDLQMASRLVDVLLVSHAAMPIYIAVALTTRFRDKLLQATLPSLLERTLRHLPKRLLREANNMEALEDVIATALEYIRLYPPHVLVTTTLNMVSSSLPSWATCAEAPTDWTLLQQAKAMRQANNQENGGMEEHDATVTTTSNVSFPTFASYHPLATAALGLDTSKHDKKKRVFIVVLVLAAGTIASCMTLSNLDALIMNNKSIPTSIVEKTSILPWHLSIPRTFNKNVVVEKNKKRNKTRMTSENKSKRRPSRRSTTTSAPTRPPSSRASVSSPQDKTQKTISLAKRFHKPSFQNSLKVMKKWKQRHLNREEMVKMATKALVEGDKIRWKGQRFLI